ncbi:MAG: RNA degradosome polyphosphate kinase, partial [Bacilli bacterium]
PLAERLKFLSIFSSNLDEFFMVRVAGLKDQVRVGFDEPDRKSNLTPTQQLDAICVEAHRLVEDQYSIWRNHLLPEFEREDFHVHRMHELSNDQLLYLEDYFNTQIYPVLTPIAIDAYRPFPMLLNRSLNLAVILNDDDEPVGQRKKIGIVQVPGMLKRYISLPSKKNEINIVFTEDVISHYIGQLFVGYDVETVTQFRITRNADLTIHEEGARDLLKVIETELKKRKWGEAVRLEVSANGISDEILNLLIEELEVEERDVFVLDGPLDFTFIMGLAKQMGQLRADLVHKQYIPKYPKDLIQGRSLFEQIRKKDVLLHHPFESFTPVVELMHQAAEDPYVLAIKQTLYRVSGDSPIIHALKRAAEKGKQVTVLVELKARFDEENNVQWAKELEKAGCHEIYGMNFLKTHSKITLIVRRKENKIERFVHLGTGNYNDVTAKIYTDLGLLTVDPDLGEDATHFFNYLTGYTDQPKYQKIYVSPYNIQDHFIRCIEEEIKFQEQFGNGRIIAKMNSLTDKPLIDKLYEASQKGVKIDLIVRGTCCLRPGIPFVSDNITVRSIVGRLLEHSRIYYFHHNGEEKYYLSSADWMTRNMEKRVEISFPIESDALKLRLKNLLQLQLEDNVKSRIQQSDGTYVKSEKGTLEVDSQKILMGEAKLKMEKTVEQDEEYL